MVAKPKSNKDICPCCLNLAKIHMVAKLIELCIAIAEGLNLAKIHMVAKHEYDTCVIANRS